MDKSVAYAINIIFEEQYLDDNNVVRNRLRTLVLDAVSDIQSTSSSTITDHPIVSGDMVADHMYKNPRTINFSGSAALKGHNGVVVDGKSITPTNLQELFDKIKNNGYLCEIVKFALSNPNEANEDLRFARYSNMVLTNIQITEKINTISFTLNWTQVLLAEVQTLDVDTDDAYLPNVTEPQTTSFTDALIDWEQVDVAVVNLLQQHKLLNPKLLDYICSYEKTALIALGAGILVGVTLAFGGGGALLTGVATLAAAGLTAATGVAVSVPVAGAIVVAAAVVTYGLVKLFQKLSRDRKYRIQVFEHYQTDKENQKEVKRLANFIGQIHQQLQSLNDVVHVYQISSDDDQECMISISNNYYIFTFTTNNTTHKKMCRVTDIEEVERAVIQDVSACPSNYMACDTSNKLFRADESGSYVYIINPPVDGEFRLSNCFVVVSDINPEDYSEALNKVINNALLR